MSLLKQKIIERIKSEGPISFESFMEMCLYYPELGYYAKDSTKIGKTGDFYTSPHLHSIFGAMLGKQMIEMWDFMKRPDPFRIVEMGAGMGYLAKDILDYLKGKEIFDHLSYTIVELNPYVKTSQQLLLKDFIEKIEWFSDLRDTGLVTGCFLSNELFDAFPVRLVEMDNELQEIYVSVSGEDFTEVKRPCGNEVAAYFKSIPVEITNGYRTEVNLKLKDHVNDINSSLNNGFVITIDYGHAALDYYSEERNRGTLLCYYQHQINENPYQNIGEQDLTAHLNFSALRNWAEEAGINTCGFCPQGTYLVSLGIDEVITELFGPDPDPIELARMKGLLIPQGMGGSHKVMIQYKGKGDPKLRGFTLRNQIGIL